MHISLSEVMVILLVAVIVVKPEHLPGVAVKLGRFVSGLRQTLIKIKREFGAPLAPTSQQSDHEQQ